MKRTILVLAIAICSNAAQATILRVNNTPGTQAAYTTLTSAINAAAIGDTLHLEASQASYGTATLNKKLRITGTGYFLNETTPNPYTQANPNSSMIESFSFLPGSKGSIVEGVVFNNTLNVSDSFITVQRCHIGATLYVANNNNVYADTIRNNYIARIATTSAGNQARNILIYNNIFSGSAPINIASGSLSNVDGYFINNCFVYNGATYIVCANFLFQNNIFAQPSFANYISANSFFNNIAGNSGIPANNNNQINVAMSSVFDGWNSTSGFSTDGKYRLKSGSPAIGTGMLNNQSIDCGAYGGPAPYIPSGMPPIPSIFSLSVPETVTSGAPSMSVSLSAASH